MGGGGAVAPVLWGLWDQSFQSIIGATLNRRDGSELVFTDASGFSRFIGTSR